MKEVPLYPHQRKAVDELQNGNILVGDVGTGKSRTVAAYYAEKESPRDVYVITTAKKRDSLDWLAEFVAFGVGTSRDATLRGVLTVDSWNNIGRYVDVKDAFFVFDEQRLVGSGSWTKSFYKIARANRWVLLSATPGDTWMDYIPVFVANGFYKNKTAFVDEHVVWMPRVKFPKVQRYLSTGKLVRLRNQILVDMPFTRTTTRKLTWKNVEFDQEALTTVVKKRWNVFEDKPLRDVAELFRVSRKVVNSDPTRLLSVRTLMEKHPRLIVFYNFDYELEQLRTLTSENQISLGASSGRTDTAQQRENGSDQTLNLRSLDQGVAAQDVEPSDSSRSMSKTRSGTSTITRSNEIQRLQDSIQRDRNLSSNLASSGKSGVMTTLSQSVGSTCVAKSSQSSSPLPGISSDVVLAEWNGHKHDSVPTSERWVYLVQYAAGSEGWNCITTDAMVFYSLTYSYKNWHQAFGRIDRLNTPYSTLYYYALVSKSWIDLAIRKSLSAKKSFNESSFGRKMTW